MKDIALGMWPTFYSGGVAKGVIVQHKDLKMQLLNKIWLDGAALNNVA